MVFKNFFIFITVTELPGDVMYDTTNIEVFRIPPVGMGQEVTTAPSQCDFETTLPHLTPPQGNVLSEQSPLLFQSDTIKEVTGFPQKDTVLDDQNWISQYDPMSIYHEDHILSDEDYHPPITSRPIGNKEAFEHDNLANIKKNDEILVGNTNARTTRNYMGQSLTNLNKGKATATATGKKSISQSQNSTSSRKGRQSSGKKNPKLVVTGLPTEEKRISDTENKRKMKKPFRRFKESQIVGKRPWESESLSETSTVERDTEWELNQMEQGDDQNTCNDEEQRSNRTEDENNSDVNHVNYKNLDQKLMRQKKKPKRMSLDNTWTDEQIHGFLDILSIEPQNRKGKGRWDAFSKELHKIGIEKSSTECSKLVTLINVAIVLFQLFQFFILFSSAVVLLADDDDDVSSYQICTTYSFSTAFICFIFFTDIRR